MNLNCDNNFPTPAVTVQQFDHKTLLELLDDVAKDVNMVAKTNGVAIDAEIQLYTQGVSIKATLYSEGYQQC